MRSRLAALAAAGLLGGWSPIVAQDSTPPPANDPAPAAVFASDLVVTASLEPRSAGELPAAVDVVDADEIERRQSAFVVELLRTLPGASLTQSGSPGKVASLFVRGASSAQTLVLLDGVVLNDPVLGAFDWSTPATAGLERVEVARGPFSALWGSAAMGGVVQLVTRAPGGREVGARLEAGSNDLAHVALGAGAPFGRFALDVAGDLRRGDGELDNDLFDADQGQLRLDARPVEGLRVGLIGRSGDAETGLPYDFFGAPSPRRRQRSESRLVALPVGEQQLRVYASPEYFSSRRPPRALRELPRHDCVVFRNPTSGRERPWEFRQQGRAVSVQPKARYVFDDGEGLVAAAEAGLGLIQVPDYLAQQAVREGRLREALADVRPPPAPISLVYASRRHIPVRLRLLIDALRAR